MEQKTIYDKKDIIRKVKGMLDRSNGTDFKAESVTALNMARELLAKHNLNMSDVIVGEKDNVSTDSAFGSYGSWQLKLARVMADYCNCDLVIQTIRKPGACRTNNRIAFVGMSAELELCVYTHAVVFDQIIKMRAKINHKRRIDFKKKGLALPREGVSFYSNGYVCGVVAYLKTELKKRVNDEFCRDLILVKDPKISEWMANHCKGETKMKSVSGSMAGYDDGYKDGCKIKLTKGIQDKGINGGRIGKTN